MVRFGAKKEEFIPPFLFYSLQPFFIDFIEKKESHKPSFLLIRWFLFIRFQHKAHSPYSSQLH